MKFSHIIRLFILIIPIQVFSQENLNTLSKEDSLEIIASNFQKKHHFKSIKWQYRKQISKRLDFPKKHIMQCFDCEKINFAIIMVSDDWIVLNYERGNRGKYFQTAFVEIKNHKIISIFVYDSPLFIDSEIGVLIDDFKNASVNWQVSKYFAHPHFRVKRRFRGNSLG